MTVAIVTDSNVSIPKEFWDGLPVFIVPMEIHHDGTVYRDGIDLTAASFYDIQRTSTTRPITSAPSPGAFVATFETAATQADEIVCLTLSSALSATHSAAEAARQIFQESNPAHLVHVIDTRSAAAAQGLMALAAGRCAQEGKTASRIVSDVSRWQQTITLYGYLDSLYHVWKSGRVPRALMWMGTLLNVKPVLQLANGEIGMVERPRTEPRAMNRVVALAEKTAGAFPVRIAVIHADARQQAERLEDRLQTTLSPVEMFISELTPVIGAHTGPGVVGCAIHRIEE